jgi:hypothetical protein
VIESAIAGGKVILLKSKVVSFSQVEIEGRKSYTLVTQQGEAVNSIDGAIFATGQEGATDLPYRGFFNSARTKIDDLPLVTETYSLEGPAQGQLVGVARQIPGQQIFLGGPRITQGIPDDLLPFDRLYGAIPAYAKIRDVLKVSINNNSELLALLAKQAAEQSVGRGFRTRTSSAKTTAKATPEETAKATAELALPQIMAEPSAFSGTLNVSLAIADGVRPPLDFDGDNYFRIRMERFLAHRLVAGVPAPFEGVLREFPAIRVIFDSVDRTTIQYAIGGVRALTKEQKAIIHYMLQSDQNLIRWIYSQIGSRTRQSRLVFSVKKDSDEGLDLRTIEVTISSGRAAK